MSDDLFNLYVWFEVMLISSFVLLELGGAIVRYRELPERGAPRRWPVSQFLFNILLAFTRMLLTGESRAPSFVSGMVVGYLILWMSRATSKSPCSPIWSP